MNEAQLIMNSVRALLRLLRAAPPGWPVWLLEFMFLASLSEDFGLLLSVPMMGVLSGGLMSLAMPR